MAEKYDYLTGKGEPTGIDTANEITASFVPGLNIAQALRDHKKAAEDKDYVGQGLSMLGLVPGGGAAVKGAAAAKAVLLPAFARLYQGSSKIAKLEDKANDIIKQGGKVSDVRNETGLFEWPGAVEKHPDYPRWGMELGAGKVYLPKQGESAPLGDILNNPELYNILPELSDVQVNFGGQLGNAAKNAHFSSSKGSINFNDQALKNHSKEQLISILDHEVNHAAMSALGQSSVSGYIGKTLTEEQLESSRRLVERLRSMGHTKVADELSRSLNHNKAGVSWQMDAGEKLADLDAVRSNILRGGTPDKRSEHGQRLFGSTGIIEPKEFFRMGGAPVASTLTEALKHVTTSPKGYVPTDAQLDSQAAYMVKFLKERGTLP